MSDHTHHVCMQPKPERLDRDRQIDLRAGVASRFAEQLEAALNGEKLSPSLNAARRRVMVEVINDIEAFPFNAAVSGNQLKVNYDNRSPHKLKSLSDGVTEFYKQVVRRFKEDELMPANPQSFILQFSMLFQAPLLAAYQASGMPSGPHTKYITRG